MWKRFQIGCLVDTGGVAGALGAWGFGRDADEEETAR